MEQFTEGESIREEIKNKLFPDIKKKNMKDDHSFTDMI